LVIAATRTHLDNALTSVPGATSTSSCVIRVHRSSFRCSNCAYRRKSLRILSWVLFTNIYICKWIRCSSGCRIKSALRWSGKVQLGVNVTQRQPRAWLNFFRLRVQRSYAET